MNSFTSIFSTNWSKKFQKYKKSQIKDPWEDKAIDSIVKKLKGKEDILASLEKVLELKSENTPCIPIGRTQDGRMQISSKKIFPHFIYCRIWRWPDLDNHNELKQISNEYCKKSFYSKLTEVCINPYHYERSKQESPTIFYNQNSPINDHSMDQSFNDESLNQSYYQNESPLNQFYFQNESSLNQSYYQNELSLNQSYYQNESNLSFQFNDNNNNLNNNFNYNYSSEYQSFSNQLNVQNQTLNFNNNVKMFDTYMETTQIKSPIQSNCYLKKTKIGWCSIVFFNYKNRLNRQIINDNNYLISGRNLPKYLDCNQGLEIKNINGNVTIQCNCKVFIQSSFLNYINGFNLDTVIELPQCKSEIIFDKNKFENLIRECYREGYEALSSLIKFSKCTISFQYGWGKQFQNINVSQRPCWLEITIDDALIILDEPLSKLNASNQQVTSVS